MGTKVNQVHPGKTPAASAVINFIGDVLFRLRYDIRIEAPPDIITDGPIIILPKHQRDADIPLGYAAMVRVLKRHAWSIMKNNLTHPAFLNFFFKIGGIPIDRVHLMRSRPFLRFARKLVQEDDIVMVLFPEQTFFVNAMGPGKAPGFRFLTKNTKKPIAINSMGVIYHPGFPRTRVILRFGPTRFITAQDDPVAFLHERMKEIAELSGLEYRHPPQTREVRALKHQILTPLGWTPAPAGGAGFSSSLDG